MLPVTRVDPHSNFPHDTGVLGNTPDVGGFATFYQRGDEAAAFNVALQHAGYATAMMGKYLNGYLEPAQDPAAPNYIPPGWSEWHVAGFGYREFNYSMNIDGTLASSVIGRATTSPT